jgi:hypothetical protein
MTIMDDAIAASAEVSAKLGDRPWLRRVLAVGGTPNFTIVVDVHDLPPEGLDWLLAEVPATAKGFNVKVRKTGPGDVRQDLR